MKNAQRISSYSNTIAVTALVISIALGLFIWNAKESAEEELLAERLQIKSLITSKELLQNDLLKVESNLDKMIKQNKILIEVEDQVSQEISSFEKKHETPSSNDRKLKSANDELLRLKSELQVEREGFNAQIASWATEKNKLITEIDILEKQSSTLTEKLNKVEQPNADYFRIEALRGKNNKQTQKAIRTTNILVSFNLNESLPNQTDSVYLSISGPNNERLPSKNKEVLTIQNQDFLVEIPIHAKVPLKTVSKGRQEILLKIQTKLKPGVYQADVYTELGHAGGAQIKLD